MGSILYAFMAKREKDEENKNLDKNKIWIQVIYI